ncbi:TPM domain-containing protein [Citromicrobium bathyomarinum]|uniref:TPM domain-containing protein n=1 Tax=Citromicrobium bathyomarinum TaxID=72174 RepID=UPI00315B0A45
MPARFAAFLTLLLAALLALPAAAQDLPPRPDGPVYDGANMIDAATKAQLDQKLRAYNKETGRAVIVATVPSLDGETIEGYAVKLYEDWGIGGEKTDEGALLLVAKEERKIRIEVGYGSTPTLTDAMSGRIIRDTITPAFKKGDFSAGIAAGVDRMIEAMNMDPATAKAIAEAEAAAKAQGGDEVTGATIGGAVVWLLLIFAFIAIFGRGKRGRRRRRYGAGSAVGDVLLWTAINSALNSGDHGGGGWGGGGGGGGGGFGGFGGGMSGGGGASGGW